MADRNRILRFAFGKPARHVGVGISMRAFPLGGLMPLFVFRMRRHAVPSGNSPTGTVASQERFRRFLLRSDTRPLSDVPP